MPEVNMGETAQHNVHKLVFLVKDFPEKELGAIIGMLQVPMVEINAMLWRAQDHGFLVADKEKGGIELVRSPEQWVFGKEVDDLSESVLYVVKKLAEGQSDLHDEVLTLWCKDYPAHDIIIATRRLVVEGKLASYDIHDVSQNEAGEDITDSYTFYTLPENLKKRWGEQQFKDEKKLQDEPIVPNDEAAPSEDSEKTQE